MRKYLIAALAALLSVAVAAVAVAQSTAPDVTAKITPSKAGTKKKPKNATFNLFVKNNRLDATVDAITVNLGKNIKLSGKGFKICDAFKLNSAGPTACPSGSKAGKGTANAVLGPGRAPLKFTVDAYVGIDTTPAEPATPTEPAEKQADCAPVRCILFYVQQVGGTVRKALVGEISRAGGKYGSKIVIKIDEDLRNPGGDVFTSLVDLQLTIKAKKGKNYLVSSTGCSSRKHNFGVKFSFAPNATFPATGSVSGTTTSACKK